MTRILRALSTKYFTRVLAEFVPLSHTQILDTFRKLFLRERPASRRAFFVKTFRIKYGAYNPFRIKYGGVLYGGVPPLLAAALWLFFCVFASQAQNAPQRSVALTFDDLPMTVIGNDHIAGDLKTTREVNQKILKQLAEHHATAIGFVNEIKLNVQGERDARAAILEDWLNAGLLLGNHGYQHLEFKDVSLETYEDELIKGEPITNALLEKHNLKQRYFRHPYLDTGGTAEKKQGFETFLTAHNYRIAPVTIQNEDWMFNASYAKARKDNDKAAIERIRQAYLDHTRDQLGYSEKLSRDSFNREIPQVMLMHDDIITAEQLSAVLSLLEQRGYHFISLDEAMADPVYSTADNYTGSDGFSWLDRWQLALGKPLHPAEPEPPKWAQEQYDAITAPQSK